MIKNKVTVLIPAYNEEHRIGKTLEALKYQPSFSEVIVVDDGSADRTALIAGKHGAKVIRLLNNRGKGGAIAAAVNQIKSQVVLLIDADLQDTAGKALALVEPVINGEADITIARFKPKQSGKGFGLAKSTAAWGIWLLTGEKLQAPLSGQRCLKKEVLGKLLPLAPRFGLEVGMTIDAIKQGYRLLEIDTDLSHSPPGRDIKGFLHRGRQFRDILSTLCSRCWRCKTH